MSCFLSYLENCGSSRGLTELVRLIDCNDPIETHLSSVHLSHEKLSEHELILARCGFFDNICNYEKFLICAKHRHNLGKYWRSKTSCQYPKHKGSSKTAVKGRDVCNLAMSQLLLQAYSVLVPIGSGK